jgi:hypothetical protein
VPMVVIIVMVRAAVIGVRARATVVTGAIITRTTVVGAARGGSSTCGHGAGGDANTYPGPPCQASAGAIDTAASDPAATAAMTRFRMMFSPPSSGGPMQHGAKTFQGED